MAVALAVLGILLVTLDQTQRLARREVVRNTLRQEAALALHRIAAVVGAAVPLASLDASPEVPEIFEPARLQVASWHGATEDALWAYTIREEPVIESQSAEAGAEGHGGTALAIVRSHLDGSPANTTPVRTALDTAVRFEYATAPDASGEIAWADRLSPGAFPALVRVRVTMRSREGGGEAFSLASVVATGAGGMP